MDARNVLILIEDKYQKRRAKALIEKSARVRRLNTISRDLVKEVLDKDMPIPLNQKASDALNKEFSKSETGLSQMELDNGMKLIARDKKGTPLKSVFEWTSEASQRILRVPAGFMRDGVQTNVEGLTLEKKALVVDLDLVENGIAKGREQMEAMITGAAAKKTPGTQGLNEVSIMQELDRKRSQLT